MLELGKPCFIDGSLSEKIISPYISEIRSISEKDGISEINLRDGGRVVYSPSSDLVPEELTEQQLFQDGGFWHILAGSLPILPCRLQDALKQEIQRVAGLSHRERVDLALKIANRGIPSEDARDVYDSTFFRKPLAILIGALTPDGCFD